ncbi:4-hydroxy-tetrahydrodipicolinate synthase [Friedmanniella endophytica]|uniref:4-hydroxy-tetrahydrodipicolinate synthase n=1 Tax=Microlunatus kandeliicorticis TaxID=1759536 RepID=A0A7W3ISQ7_9ACTN|nr:4-hydroxy-tetrahydrodipicolinate synthase [Microlunatus kandeliicorticis]MBA8794485.1 4-hydroxy-tetrahydrodipicolinate synthase [Microlunatus kandeliicorticis]
MLHPAGGAAPVFGRLLSAMVTPFDASGALDLEAAAALARHLVDEQAHDGLVVNGTGGEAPTTSDTEKAALVRAVVEAVGDRAAVVAGVGTFDTAHTLELLAAAEEAGADGALVVTPYYSRPPQSGLLAHFTAVADRAGIGLLLYDIPHRAGVPIAPETLIELAGHPRVLGVKDAKGDLTSTSAVLAATDLLYYSGDDATTLPMLAVGGCGVIGTSTHFCGPQVQELIAAALEGRRDDALALHQRLLPIFTGIFATQGCILVKAGLELRGRGVGGVRSPMVPATDAQREALAAALAAAGL